MLSVGKEQKIQIKEFDVAKMHQNASMIILGMNRCYELVPKQILEHYKNVSNCYVISRDSLMEQFYKTIFPNISFHDYGDMNIFETVLKQQIANKKTEQSTQVMIIMDYCGFEDMKKWFRNQHMREILYNGRHYNITYIMTCPISLRLNPNLRTLFDYIFIRDTDLHTDHRYVYNDYAGMFQTFDSFMEVYTQIMKNNSLMVLNRINNSVAQEICDKVFYL